VRALVVSDIHANLTALNAVLREAEGAGPIDAVWNMGDCVGYGPQPVECVSRMRDAGAVWVAGNHERAATGAIGTEDFNAQAAAAAIWTGEQLGQADKAFLDALPETAQQTECTLVHGTLRWPLWEYLYDHDAALGHLALQSTPVGFVGHTHVPMSVEEDSAAPEGCRMRRLSDGEVVSIGGPHRVVLNPGSVGQPRDGDPRASFGIYDSDDRAFTLRRVEYDIAVTQRLMEEAALPAWLIQRLASGR
jgi:diadenosine tetraphosphatase ApaH/serine/threonine PP2A family protein phosphatase